jgi:hypothetical protein
VAERAVGSGDGDAAAVRVRCADFFTTVSATLVSSATVWPRTVVTFAASLRPVVMVALADRSMSAAARRAEVTAPLAWATVTSAWATRSWVAFWLRMRVTRVLPRAASSS